MTLAELKKAIARLSLRDRRELNAYLIQLRHETPEWKRLISKRMKEMDSGRKVGVPALEQRINSSHRA